MIDKLINFFEGDSFKGWCLFILGICAGYFGAMILRILWLS